jgi:ABC-type nickel/cobalt efflux system permease component RcnA
MEQLLHEQLTTAFENLGVVYLLIAVALGALHSLEPGHGKALISIYFIGRKRSLWDVALLAIIVTVTHTFSVIILAALGAGLAHAFWRDQFRTGLEIVGGAAILALGIFLWARAQRVTHARHFHTEAQQHRHDCDKVHGARSMGELLSLGIVAGLVPCPAGVAVLLLAVSQQKIGSGLVLTFAFSLGVGLLIFLVGLGMWKAMKWTETFFKNREQLIILLPKISALVIIAVGAMALTHGILSGSHSHGH